MTNNNIWDCAERSLSIDDSSVYKTFFFVFLVCMIHCSFQNNSELLKHYVFAFEFFF
jgi:hypothetical protein